MSDGPHRSLPMRKPWKELAKRGDQSVYDVDQVVEAATNALASDFKSEVKWSVIDSLKAIFTGRDNSLMLSEIALQELENAKVLAAGSVFGMNAVAWSAELINDGRFGLDAFHEAIGLAGKMRGFANVRSVEEHYLRESNHRRADYVGKRLYNAISSLSDGQLGLILAAPESTRTPRSSKKTQIDEGVPLC
ncbi:hypothetical protein [Caballeronia sp. GAWG2-1]|uniref:hypothetical protein n=1 Tax=Caballeronia sp. GAWG2-1 TaxID=2921744 RepID=UPI0020277FBB|nr:hypothetical protein [Caballeronia sp. GAWG2-1]